MYAQRHSNAETNIWIQFALHALTFQIDSLLTIKNYPVTIVFFNRTWQ